MIFLTDLLDASHDKKHFDCGRQSLNNYLHTQAKQDMKRKLSACFVLVNAENKVIGYYTLSNASVPRNQVPDPIQRKMPIGYSDLPATLLGRLAVSKDAMGKGLGKHLLVDALRRSFETAKSIGSMAVIVDPLDREAEQFYLKYGFVKIPDSGKMFLAMATVFTLFSGKQK